MLLAHIDLNLLQRLYRINIGKFFHNSVNNPVTVTLLSAVFKDQPALNLAAPANFSAQLAVAYIPVRIP